MDYLSEKLNYIENEITSFKTNLGSKRIVDKVYTYTIPFKGTMKANQGYVQQLNIKFKGGFSPIVSISATGTVNGKSISNRIDGGLGYRAVNYMGFGDYKDINYESVIPLAVSGPYPFFDDFSSNPEWNSNTIDFDFLITVKSLTEIEVMTIGEFSVNDV